MERVRPNTLKVSYFAMLRECAGKREEDIATDAITALELYAELQHRYGFALEARQIAIAINDQYASWDTELHSGDHVVFVPPVSGG